MGEIGDDPGVEVAGLQSVGGTSPYTQFEISLIALQLSCPNFGQSGEPAAVLGAER